MPMIQKFSGAKIRIARHSAGLTQAQLATAAGTRERNIIRWENDQHTPRLEHVAAIAEATGKDVAFFLSDGEVAADDDGEAELLPDLDLALRSYLRRLIREEVGV